MFYLTTKEQSYLAYQLILIDNKVFLYYPSRVRKITADSPHPHSITKKNHFLTQLVKNKSLILKPRP